MVKQFVPFMNDNICEYTSHIKPNLAGLGDSGSGSSSRSIQIRDDNGCSIIFMVNGSLEQVYAPHTSVNHEIMEEESDYELTETFIPLQLVETEPSFNGGGVDAFVKWVDKNKVYPQDAKKSGHKGTRNDELCCRFKRSSTRCEC